MEEKKMFNLEMAQIMGEPKDPRKPYPAIVEAVFEFGTAAPNDYQYIYDVLLDTDKVVSLANGTYLTTENVTPDNPTLLSFNDVGTPEYFMKVQDLATSKEQTLARKRITLNRALNAREIHYTLGLLDAAAVAVGHNHNLGSGLTRFSFPDLIDMLEEQVDYGDNYALTYGSDISRDIKLWNWNDNKYSDLLAALKDLNVTQIRCAGNVTIDGVATPVIQTSKAYLVARDTEIGKPGIFVRKNLNDIDMLGGAMLENGDKPQRLVFIGQSPVTVDVAGTAQRYLGISITAYENIVASVTNPYGISTYSKA